MSIYKIRMNFSDDREKYFLSYQSMIDNSVDVFKDFAKIFMKKEHAEKCIKNIVSTNKQNKSSVSGCTTKYDEFMHFNPTFLDFSIEEVESCDSSYFVYYVLNHKKFYIKEIDDMSIAITPVKSSAKEYFDYELLKDDCKKTFKNGWFTNSETLIETVLKERI